MSHFVGGVPPRGYLLIDPTESLYKSLESCINPMWILPIMIQICIGKSIYSLKRNSKLCAFVHCSLSVCLCSKLCAYMYIPNRVSLLLSNQRKMGPMCLPLPLYFAILSVKPVTGCCVHCKTNWRVEMTHSPRAWSQWSGYTGCENRM